MKNIQTFSYYFPQIYLRLQIFYDITKYVQGKTENNIHSEDETSNC